MKIAQKKLAEEYIKLLNQAHQGMKKAIETKKRDVTRDLLEQCQEIAIRLGNMIEETEGEGSVAVQLLEDYCERVYQIYVKNSVEETIHVSKTYKGLHRLLVQIENCIKYEMEMRIEAVFLPYKASMWDSMESVWKAADKDSDCDAYVIPIPYYDKNPDGSFGKEHYEGNQYPDYVPITRYDTYDFETRQPDIIFIHNPYDECNYVTSVHPFFYSKNLKLFTNRLVYMPYFILEEIEPENKEETRKIEHFCTVPGVINADKVIVQSKGMRRIYIDTLVNAAGKDTKQYWEDKIIGLGSPKIEKVLSSGKENQKIPQEWLSIIEKRDKSRKKIIFYNTIVSTLLVYGEEYLKKIEETIQIFSEYKEQYVLLWRPHPLVGATLASMRPELEERYWEIVDGFQKCGAGIYDDSSDLHRAISLSDAYYGDGGSVLNLYMETGKPVLIHDFNY